MLVPGRAAAPEQPIETSREPTKSAAACANDINGFKLIGALGEAQSGAQQLTEVVGRPGPLRRIDEVLRVGLFEAHLGERPERLARELEGGDAQPLAVGRAVCVPERKSTVGVAFDAQRAVVDGTMVGAAQGYESSRVMAAAFAPQVEMMHV